MVQSSKTLEQANMLIYFQHLERLVNLILLGFLLTVGGERLYRYVVLLIYIICYLFHFYEVYKTCHKFEGLFMVVGRIRSNKV